MRWWIGIPGALVPHEVARAAAAAMPNELARALIHADTLTVEHDELPAAPHLQAAWHAFGGSGPAAVAHLRAPVGTPPQQVWLCEPVHFALARDHLLLQPLESLDNDTLNALMQVADAAAAAAGASIRRAGASWLLTTHTAWALDTTPLDGALGRPLADCSPVGADALRWRKLLTDIQVEWHAHPINAARADAGLPAINGLWLHGGLTQSEPPALRSSFATVVGAHPWLAEWAQATGMAPAQQVAADAAPAPTGDAISMQTDLLAAFHAGDWGSWLRAWQACAVWLDDALTRARSAGLDLQLHLWGERTHVRIEIRPYQRWRVWRRDDERRRAAVLTESLS